MLASLTGRPHPRAHHKSVASPQTMTGGHLFSDRMGPGLRNITRVLLAVVITIIGFGVTLQQASAEPTSEDGAGAQRVFLPMIAADTNPGNRSSTNSPSAAISVAAHAAASCEDSVMLPVSGARITVAVDSSSRVAMTDVRGYALFSATAEPAIIQIEWPAGFLPCPDSRPAVELPNGTGEVRFKARFVNSSQNP